MILCSYDIETTGLDKQKDRIIEIGLALYSTGQRKILESTGFLVESDGVPITSEITELTGVTQAAVDKFGWDVNTAHSDTVWFMSQADAVIAHNGNRFDRPFSENTAKRLNGALPDKLWIDTMTDIPGVKGEQLVTMAAKHGFVNLFPHSALTDCQTVLKLIEGYDIDKIVERARSPLVLIQSHQDRGKNADAKKFQFRWNPDRKIWWKPVKEMDLEGLIKDVPFDVSRLGKEVTFEQLDS